MDKDKARFHRGVVAGINVARRRDISINIIMGLIKPYEDSKTPWYRGCSRGLSMFIKWYYGYKKRRGL